MIVVLLAAGQGSRLWPISSPEKPKQFQPLLYGQSLLQYSYGQLQTILPNNKIYVQTLAEHEHHVTEQLRDCQADHVLLVPEHRDTLGETIYAVANLAVDPNEPIMFKSVDQYVPNPKQYLSELLRLVQMFNRDLTRTTLVTAGYDEFLPNAGYCIVDKDGEVYQFIEKPSLAELERISKTDSIQRSLFIFMTSKNILMKDLNELQLPWARQAIKLLTAQPSVRTDQFLEMPTLDISSTLFQHSQRLRAIQLKGSHNFLDVGRYAALYELNTKDDHGNVVIGYASLGYKVEHNLIFNDSETEALVVNDTKHSIIVKTGHGTMVSSLADSNRVGQLSKGLHVRS